MINNLGIFFTYDEQGIVDESVLYTISQLETVVSRLIIVSNAELCEKELVKLREYTDEIIVRENVGFDVGAYADVLISYIGQERLEFYDEVILCNDTFFGPFIPMVDIVVRMRQKECDICGLNIVDRGLLTHIQSYFLLFNKRVIQSGDLYGYFSEKVDPKETNIKNVYGIAEPYLWDYYQARGYVLGALIDTECFDIYKSSDYCLEKYKMPYMKKKCFYKQFANGNVLRHSLEIIRKEYGFQKRNILEHASRVYGYEGYERNALSCVNASPVNMGCSSLKPDELLAWCDKGDFYIYGAGMIAKQIYHLYCSRHKKFLGFVVSCKENVTNREDYPVYEIGEIKKGSRIMIGVNIELQEEIYQTIKEDMCALVLWDIIREGDY